jgi:hypothetical protein
LHRQLTAVELDFAGVGRQRAGDDFQQRRFAGAVGANEAVDLALDHVEIDALQSGHGAETLADSFGGIND